MTRTAMTETAPRRIFTFAPSPRPEHFGQMQGASTVPWAKLEEVRVKVAITLEARQIMLLSGPAGTGKTHALRYVLQGHDFAELVFSETPNRNETLNAIHIALFGKPARGNAGEIERTLRIALRQHRVILVVDEVESLNNKRRHLLRILQDFPGSQLTLFLIGDESSREIVDSDPRLSRRILTDVHFTAMSCTAVQKYLPAYHPMFAGVGKRLLRELYEESFGGTWGNIARWTKLAEYALAQEHADGLSPHLIARVQDNYWMPRGKH